MVKQLSSQSTFSLYDRAKRGYHISVCFSQEYKHLYGKEKLTFAEKRKLIRALKTAYADLKWKRGGYKGGKEFDR